MDEIKWPAKQIVSNATWVARVGATLMVRQFRHAYRVRLKMVGMVAYGRTRNEAISNLREIVAIDVEKARQHNRWTSHSRSLKALDMRRPQRSLIKQVVLG